MARGIDHGIVSWGAQSLFETSTSRGPPFRRPFARVAGVEGCTLTDVCGRLLALVLLRRRPNGKSVCFHVNSWGPIAWERRPNGTLLDVCEKPRVFT